MSLGASSGLDRIRQHSPAGQMLFVSAEADVMRLVAVLALCLMLLFAAEQHFGPHDGSAAPQVTPVQRPDSTSSAPLDDAHSSAASSTSQDQSASGGGDEALANTVLEEVSEPSVSPNDEQRSLVFASDAAFIRLLAQEAIALYVLREDSWRQVTLGGSRPSQTPAGTVYGLKLETVPEVLRTRASTGSAQADARWTVQLSTDIQGQIDASLQAGGLAGLVIEGNGEVRRLNSGTAQR